MNYRVIYKYMLLDLNISIITS
uniref:Uncharacterized protein n=1 Tax=Lepeophtheirus salmonis TaxID=72036 RepID=A0A0K2T2J6_LEPSM